MLAHIKYSLGNINLYKESTPWEFPAIIIIILYSMQKLNTFLLKHDKMHAHIIANNYLLNINRLAYISSLCSENATRARTIHIKRQKRADIVVKIVSRRV